MLITIKSEKTNKEAEIYMPTTEKSLQQFCERLGVENNMKEKVNIISIEHDDRSDKLLKNQTVNLDELNFLINRINGLSTEDLDSLYAVAYTEKTTSVKDLINLSYNTHCYDVVTAFGNLEAIGRRMYQNNELKAVLNDFKASDFEDYAEMVLKNQIPAVTPYGLIYFNENKHKKLESMQEHIDGDMSGMMEYDDRLVRQIIHTIKVVDESRVVICFKNGLEVEQDIELQVRKLK